MIWNYNWLKMVMEVTDVTQVGYLNQPYDVWAFTLTVTVPYVIHLPRLVQALGRCHHLSTSIDMFDSITIGNGWYKCKVWSAVWYSSNTFRQREKTQKWRSLHYFMYSFYSYKKECRIWMKITKHFLSTRTVFQTNDKKIAMYSCYILQNSIQYQQKAQLFDPRRSSWGPFLKHWSNLQP